MINLIIAARRRSDITRDEFIRYWKEDHAPLVLSVLEFSRHLRRYVQHPVAADPDGHAAVLGIMPDYDGIGELWFDDHASMVAAFNEPRYLEIIRPDEEKFLDRDNSLSFVTETLVQKELEQ